MVNEAADQGYAKAQCNLGLCAIWPGRGSGLFTAMKWYRMAADQRIAQAQFNLGVMYNNGQGVVQDYSAAMKWFRMAAEQKCTSAVQSGSCTEGKGWLRIIRRR